MAFFHFAVDAAVVPLLRSMLGSGYGDVAARRTLFFV